MLCVSCSMQEKQHNKCLWCQFHKLSHFAPPWFLVFDHGVEHHNHLSHAGDEKRKCPAITPCQR